MPIDKTKLSRIENVFPMKVSLYETYGNEEDNQGVISKVNSMIKSLHQMGRLTNEIVKQWNTVMLWVVENGIEDTTKELLNEMLSNGKFEKLVASAIENIHEEVNQTLKTFYVRLENFATKADIASLGQLRLTDSFATLANLKTAFPNGAKGIYLVLEDGFIYSWKNLIWTKLVQFQSTGIQNGSIGYTQMKLNSLDTSVLNKTMLTDEMVELFNTKTISKGMAISGLTAELIEAPSGNVTDFILVPANSNLIYTANGVSVFTDKVSALRKIAVWDSNMRFIKTLQVRDLDSFVMDFNCIIRIAYASSDSNISIKTDKTKKISRKAIENKSDFDYYKSTEKIELFDESKANRKEAYEGTTSTLILVDGFILTDFMFIPEGKKVSLKFNGVDWKTAPVTQLNSTKIIVFDEKKVWESTVPLKNFSVNNFEFPNDKHIRIQVQNSDVPSVSLDGMFKLDKEKIMKDYSSSIEQDGYDVFVFAGQSNMAGRGTDLSIAPKVGEFAFEYKAITNPLTLSPLVEPFGVAENVVGKIDDRTMKTGSMVASFAKAYHDVTKEKIIAISASEGGTKIESWLPGTPRFTDLVDRINRFKNFAVTNEMKIRKIHFVWNQGEGNGNELADVYEPKLNQIIEGLSSVGIDKCLLVRIGHFHTADYALVGGQTEIAKRNKKVVMVGNLFAKLSRGETNYLKDEVHFTQLGYNIQGEQVGLNTAFYVKNLKEPTMFDPQFNNLYYSHTD